MKNSKLVMSNVKMRMRKYFLQYAFFITHCALILFLVNCDLKVKTENTALFKLFSVFFIGSSTVPMPAFNPSTGTHNTDQYVTLYNTISGATIYYTTDGSIPTANSTPYTGAILIEGNGTTKTVQSVAIKSGMTDSNVSSGTYKIDYTALPMPSLNPAVGTYNTDQLVTLSSANARATIYYTTDGSTPTTSSTKYTTAISVAGNGTTKTIQALATRQGMADSSIVSGTYTIKYPDVSMPTFNPPQGTFTTDTLVTLNTTTQGATIYYTLDGSIPTVNSNLYNGAISITGNGITKIIQAFAVKAGMGNSSIANGIYKINYIAAPTFSIMPDVYNSDQTIAMSTATSGSTIYYTSNGVTPTTTSTVYTAPISITGNGTGKTIKAIAVKSDTGNSPLATGTWKIDSDIPTVITVAPLSGNSGIITTTNVTSTSLTLYWTKANDADSPQSSLQYKIVKSLSNNIDTITNAEANGTLVQDWTVDIDSVNVTGLIANTTYYFNVLVRDSFWNKGLYAMMIPPVTYDWGTFTDNLNGTVRFDGVAGTFGGNTYIAQTLTWMKCSQGQIWNPATNDCKGTGNSGDNYGAISTQFCSSMDNNCNGGITSNELGVGGFLSSSTSSAYNQCNSIGNYSGKTGWRVPKKDELKTLIHCSNKIMPNETPSYCDAGYISPTVSNLFPDSVVERYWSSTTDVGDISTAWFINFTNGGSSSDSKNYPFYVRCVSGP